jgi:hypothetical protein
MPVMRTFVFGIVIAALGSLAACHSKPPIETAADAVDDRYGIPPFSVPTHMLKSDGFLINGLLPAQPYD